MLNYVHANAGAQLLIPKTRTVSVHVQYLPKRAKGLPMLQCSVIAATPDDTSGLQAEIPLLLNMQKH